MDSFDILVIILSVTLFVLLVLVIVATVYVIKVIKQLQRVSDKVAHVVDNVESASEILKRAAGPISVTKVVSSIVELYNDRKKGGSSK